MYMRTGSVVRPNSESSVLAAASASFLDVLGRRRGRGFRHQQRVGVGRLVEDLDAHVADHRDHALDLLGVDQVVGQVVVDLGVGEVAALLAEHDQALEAALARLDVGRGQFARRDVGVLAVLALLARLQVGRELGRHLAGGLGRGLEVDLDRHGGLGRGAGGDRRLLARHRLAGRRARLAERRARLADGGAGLADERQLRRRRGLAGRRGLGGGGRGLGGQRGDRLAGGLRDGDGGRLADGRLRGRLLRRVLLRDGLLRPRASGRPASARPTSGPSCGPASGTSRTTCGRASWPWAS
jgi:hypothetical protein